MAIGLGSNLGSRLDHLAAGSRALRGILDRATFSRVYETRPVGVVEQPRFLNACGTGWTDLEPETLLRELKAAESARGRRRGARWGPRELDLDILLYGDEIVETGELRIPHPELVHRAFVLVPLAEIAGSWVHPVAGVTVAELAARLDPTGVEATNLQLTG